MNGGMNYWIVKHTAPYRARPGPRVRARIRYVRFTDRIQGRLSRNEVLEFRRIKSARSYTYDTSSRRILTNRLRRLILKLQKKKCGFNFFTSRAKMKILRRVSCIRCRLNVYIEIILTSVIFRKITNSFQINIRDYICEITRSKRLHCKTK